MHRTSAFISAATILSLLVCAGLSAQTEPITQTIPLNVWLPPGSTAACSHASTPRNIQFTDTAGADFTKLEVRARMAYTNLVPSIDSPPTVTILINGQQIGQPQQILNRSTSCNNRLPYTFESGNLPNYVAFGTNTFTVISDGGYAGGARDEPVELVFTTPRATFQFELVPNATARMLIHNYNPQGALPPYQLAQASNGRPRFRFGGAVNVDGAGAARDVWFRVADPPDSAPYGSPKSNDNVDREKKGFLTTPDCTEPSCRVYGFIPLKTRSDASGVVAVVLEGTDRYAGDNYQLEASFDAQFTCATAGPGGTNVCAKSGVVTAWKRIYVEAHKMFKRGAFLTGDVPAGSTTIPVDDVSDFPAPPFRIRLIHAPPVWDGSRSDFYEEEVEVRDLTGRRMLNRPGPGKLHLRHPSEPAVGDAVSRIYTGPDVAGALTERQTYLADAVGLVDGTSSAFQSVDPSLAAGLFDDAFVEFIWLKDDNQREWTHPFYQRVVPRVSSMDGIAREWLTRRWIRNASPFGEERSAAPNHQFVFLAERSERPERRGATTVSEGFNDAWLFCDMFTSVAMRGEGFAHELGHEWRVNSTWLIPTTTSSSTGGHCDDAIGTDQFIHDRPTHLCLMHSTLYSDPMNPGVADGIIGFHFTNVAEHVDSEYLRIRERAEPVPQNERVGRIRQ